MQNRLFIKVYCNADLHDQVHELARLLGTSAGGLVREYLTEEINLERRLEEARATEAQRLAMLQASASQAGGQIDFIANGKGGPPGRSRRERSERRPPRTSGKQRKRRTKPVGARKRGGR